MSCRSEERLPFHPWQCWQILCAPDEGRFQKKTFIFKVPQATSGKCIADCPFRAGEGISLPPAQLCNLPQVICKWNEEVQPKKPVLSSASTIVLQSHPSILEFNSFSFLTFGRLPADFKPMQHLLLWFLWHFLLVPSLKWLVLSFYDYPPFFSSLLVP